MTNNRDQKKVKKQQAEKQQPQEQQSKQTQEDMLQKQGYYAEGVEKLRELLPKEFIETVKDHLQYTTFIRKRKNKKDVSPTSTEKKDDNAPS